MKNNLKSPMENLKKEKIEKLKNGEFKGDYLEMIVFVFDWCVDMQKKINQIIERLNEI